MFGGQGAVVQGLDSVPGWTGYETEAILIERQSKA